MKLAATHILVLGVAFTMGAAYGLSISDKELASLSWKYTKDSNTDTAGTSTFTSYGSGYAISGGFLYVVIQTNFPEAGTIGNDSYSRSTHISPGDLYLNVGGTFQGGGGTAYGIATTSHANVVQQAYAGQTWTPVTAGSLYKNATSPDDGDGNNNLNSYPTLITSGSLVGGDVSGVRYRANGASDAWDWDIFYKVSLSALGLTGGETLQSFWVMECGNDGVQQMIHNPAVPEPTTIALMAAGMAAFAVRRRAIV